MRNNSLRKGVAFTVFVFFITVGFTTVNSNFLNMKNSTELDAEEFKGAIESKTNEGPNPCDPDIDTSVDTISPYNQDASPLSITATGPSDLDNISLYYRWSEDNNSWGWRATT